MTAGIPDDVLERAIEVAALRLVQGVADGADNAGPDYYWENLTDSSQDAWREIARDAITAALSEVEASLAAERDDLAARIARVEALHVEHGFWMCCIEDGMDWPCPTIKALRAEHRAGPNPYRKETP